VPEPLQPAIDALAKHHPTWRHGLLLFETIVERLGALAVIDSANAGASRWLYRRVAERSTEIVPWPVATIEAAPLSQGAFDVEPDDAADWWKTPSTPEGTSRLRGLRSGRVKVLDGRQSLELGYGENGVLAERCINGLFPGRLAELADVLAAKDGPPHEQAAAFVAALDHGRYGPGRARMPVPMPGGTAGIWAVGRAGARRALFDGRVPPTARFLVVDGVAGTAIAWGTTVEETEAGFRTLVEREIPRPDLERQTITDDYDDDGNLIARGELDVPFEAPDEGEPPAAPEIDPVTGRVELGSFVLQGPASDVPMPDLTPATVPSVLVPLDLAPATPPPTGRWIRTLGDLGATCLAARFKAEEGYILAGERALTHVERGHLLAQLQDADERDAHSAAALTSEYEAFFRFQDTLYAWEPRGPGHEGRFRTTGGSRGPRFDAAGIDGERLLDQVLRHLRIRRGSRS
jgi:hypothetical protein